MAFDDYLALRLAVAEYVGNRSITDVMPRITQQAETRLNRDLRNRNMIATATVTMASGSGTLPTDFLEMLQVMNGTCELRQVSIDLLNREYSNIYIYAVNGSNLLINNADGDQVITYYQKLPTITGSLAGTNWLLAAAPSLYLYAVAREASKFLNDEELEARSNRHYADELGEVNAANSRSQWADSHVRIQGVTP